MAAEAHFTKTGESWQDRFVDEMPPKLWPKVYGIAVGWNLLIATILVLGLLVNFFARG
ncbi:MAG: hypothetical protein NW208_01865 [Bryobacter sp.]|nr:hypothetical protein [Bryobacter sp.]